MAENLDASTQEPHDAEHESDEALKKRLLSRIAVAGVVIVALLGGLAVMDALFGPPQKKMSEEAVVAKIEADAQKDETKPEEKAGEKPEEKAETPPPADKPAEVAQIEPPPKPEVAAEPERTTSVAMPPPAATRPLRPLTLPATARPAAIKPSAPVAATAPEVEKEIAKTPAPASPFAKHAPASRPLTQAVASSRQYVLQMGVFNNVANAEELRAKLELAGIPSQIEARVQVGPFRTRQEADNAREKLRALGMETGILTALKK